MDSETLERLPHPELLDELWKAIAALLPKVKSDRYQDSLWFEKEKLFACVGRNYRGLENGRVLFWQHLKILARAHSVPRFTTRNKLGKNMCIKSGKVGSKWCATCDSGTRTCGQCMPAIRFVKPDYDFEAPNSKELAQILVPKIPVEIPRPHFKSAEFARYLLPRITGCSIAPDCFLPRFVERILESENNELAKTHDLLNGIYGIRRKRLPAIWIAPTQEDNEATSLDKKIVLNASNNFGLPNGHYYVWGFNASMVAKWHTLKMGDYIVCGNTRHGFNNLGRVSGKFIWKNEASSKIFDYTSPSGHAWLWGFTMNMRPISISGDEMREIVGEYYQTQTRLRGDKCQKLAVRLGVDPTTICL
jgi:hypothetical protein